jgi:hypothetical protein
MQSIMTASASRVGGMALVVLTFTSPAVAAAEPTEPMTPRVVVEMLASDAMGGRDNETEGSLAARLLLIDELKGFAQPAFPELAGDAGYLQPFPGGVNVVAMIPGEGIPDEYVVLGAHYDHLGTGGCASSDATDRICNGATDNATGVAVALEAARSLAAVEGPRRSVLVALWDAEEDDLLGSTHYTTSSPIVPLEDTVAYLNLDNQGSDLVPSARHITFAVGAETGGAVLVEAVRRAAATSTLDTLMASVAFGQGRSDHQSFVNVGVPSVFFTDATSACYHTTRDDVTGVDFDKLDQQIGAFTALAHDLATTTDPPMFVGDNPLATYDDAVSILGMVTAVEPDLDLLGPGAAEFAHQYLTDLRSMVEAGADAFDGDATNTLLVGAVTFVDALTHGDCDALDP